MKTLNGDTAKMLSELMVAMGAQLNESLRLVQETESEEEFKRYREVVSRLMTIMLVDVMNPVYAEHPGLRPRELE
ncbi:hypothetical protein P2318_07005 [Myxococcaceae bacterium GXIMD 01537]